MNQRAESRSGSGPVVPVVFACDANYAMPLATTMRSLVESNVRHWPLDLIVLSDGELPGAMRARVEASLPSGAARVRWVNVDLATCADLPTLPHISRATYARLIIPRVLPELERVLYLDADLLVLDDLSPVWTAKLGGRPVGAVRDVMDAIIKRNEPGWDDVPRVENYFNAGVLLMDLAAWRREHIAERALEFLATHPHTRLADQDALNVTCDGRWFELPARWNLPCFQNENIGDLSPGQLPGIAHFVTRRKPWVARYRSPHAAFYDTFRRRTQYARTPGERLCDGWVRFVAGCRNVLERRGWVRPGDAWTPPKPVRKGGGA